MYPVSSPPLFEEKYGASAYEPVLKKSSMDLQEDLEETKAWNTCKNALEVLYLKFQCLKDSSGKEALQNTAVNICEDLLAHKDVNEKNFFGYVDLMVSYFSDKKAFLEDIREFLPKLLLSQDPQRFGGPQKSLDLAMDILSDLKGISRRMPIAYICKHGVSPSYDQLDKILEFLNKTLKAPEEKKFAIWWIVIETIDVKERVSVLKLMYIYKTIEGDLFKTSAFERIVAALSDKAFDYKTSQEKKEWEKGFISEYLRLKNSKEKTSFLKKILNQRASLKSF